MTVWEKIVLGPVIYLVVATGVRVVDERRWRSSLTAWSLRLPVDVDAAQAGRWIGTLAAMMDSLWWWFSIPRWWPLGLARWPISLELAATPRGVQRVLIIPQPMTGEVLDSLAAVIPGARTEELPDYLADRSYRWRVAKELRLTGTRQLLDRAYLILMV